MKSIITLSNITIGATLKQLRKNQGFKQNEVAKHIQLSQTYMSLIEGGKREPTLSTVIDFCNAIGLVPKISFEKAK